MTGERNNIKNKYVFYLFFSLFVYFYIFQCVQFLTDPPLRKYENLYARQQLSLKGKHFQISITARRTGRRLRNCSQITWRGSAQQSGAAAAPPSYRRSSRILSGRVTDIGSNEKYNIPAEVDKWLSGQAICTCKQNRSIFLIFSAAANLCY